MDVVVAGGHGKIGIRLLRLPADRGHRARGLVEIGVGLERGEIPRDDVAAALLFTLDAVNTYGRAFDVVSGDDPVGDAVAAIAA